MTIGTVKKILDDTLQLIHVGFEDLSLKRATSWCKKHIPGNYKIVWIGDPQVESAMDSKFIAVGWYIFVFDTPDDYTEFMLRHC